MRTRTSRTLRMPGGRYLTQLYRAPVNYRDARGRWRIVDDRLV